MRELTIDERFDFAKKIRWCLGLTTNLNVRVDCHKRIYNFIKDHYYGLFNDYNHYSVIEKLSNEEIEDYIQYLTMLVRNG